MLVGMHALAILAIVTAVSFIPSPAKRPRVPSVAVAVDCTGIPRSQTLRRSAEWAVALSKDDAVQAAGNLDELAIDAGAPALACALTMAIASYKTGAATADDPTSRTELGRRAAFAQHYLDARHYSVAVPPR